MRTLALLVLLAALGCGGQDDPSRAGEPCVDDEPCGSLVCVADHDAMNEDLDALALVCGEPRDARAPGEACEEAEDCALGVCLLAGACARPCDQESTCTDGERCKAVYARVEDGLATLRACVARVSLPEDTRITRELRKGAFSGGIDSIRLPSVSDETPALFVLEHLNDDDWPASPMLSTCRPPLCAEALIARDQGSAVLFDSMQLTRPEGPKNPIAVGDYINPLTVLIPNGPRGGGSDDGYTLELESGAAGDLLLTQLSRTRRGSRLDLNVYYLGTDELAPTGSRGPTLLADAFEEVDRIFAAADIFIGDVRQIEVRGRILDEGSGTLEVGAGFAQLSLRFGVYAELPRLFELSAGAGNVAVDVFLVDDIGPDAQGARPVGIAGGTPVPLGMHGTPSSGLVIPTRGFLSSDDAQGFGRVLAHELAHALGLFHTTERSGAVFDPLPDTPVCSLDTDRNDDGVLDAGECAGHGADNLMFPSTDATASELSADQIDVLRGALVLQ